MDMPREKKDRTKKGGIWNMCVVGRSRGRV